MVVIIRQGHYRDKRTGETKVLVRMLDSGLEFNDGTFENYGIFNEYYEVVKANED